MRAVRLRAQAPRSDLDFGRNQRLRDDDAERWLPGQFGAAERDKLASVAHPEGLATMASGKAPDGPDGSQADTSVEPENLDPLAYMLRVMNDPGAEPERRDRMTIAAAPFVHRQAAATGRFAPRPPPKFAA